MKHVRYAVVHAVVFGLSTVVAMPALEAQAFHYPSLQVPSASTRDYTGGLASGAGTTALFQWREGWAPGRHWQLDGGLVDRKGRESLSLFAGVGVAQEVTRATKEQPLDLLLTANVGASFGSGSSLVRIPVGMSIGHTFPLENDFAITPFVHPRASIDVCGSCGTEGRSRSEVSLNFDLGASFQVNREFAVRASGGFTGSDLVGGQDTFAVGFTWTPAPLVRRK